VCDFAEIITATSDGPIPSVKSAALSAVSGVSPQ
jgi:hypothetical protein